MIVNLTKEIIKQQSLFAIDIKWQPDEDLTDGLCWLESHDFEDSAIGEAFEKGILIFFSKKDAENAKKVLMDEWGDVVISAKIKRIKVYDY